ncbi:carbohydrate ABC transporter permease [Microbacterium sp. Bi128]|uniref:carbohydrate ABC transporter permease n=1 Tax=Microbacterium sp. Bi128 TaxID=2821115 RepID=UPI001DFAE829|nr:sugar ABC transporter permease [Microbacterium sp. Bi128]CAH0137201.1 Lactose transport system permease protein LacF [Microbacterium sp. Bi128]
MTSLRSTRPDTGSRDKPEPSAVRPSLSSRFARWDKKYSAYVYILPFFILFALVGAIPLVYTAWVSLNDWSLIGGQGEFIGIENYVAVLGERNFWLALRNTISIFIIQVIPQLVIGLAIAAALDRNLRNATLWRMGVLLPFIVMPVAVALIFNSLYGDQYGLINTTLQNLGLPPVGWHSDVLASHIAIATMVDYRWTGYAALILLAGMQAIPRDYYEAATIDGAGSFRQFFSITIPQLRGTLIFVVVTATISGLQIFDEPRLYDDSGLGGSDGQWLTMTLYLYKLGWNDLDFGRASAVAWLLFCLIAIIALINLFITTRISSSSRRKGE